MSYTKTIWKQETKAKLIVKSNYKIIFYTPNQSHNSPS